MKKFVILGVVLLASMVCLLALLGLSLFLYVTSAPASPPAGQASATAPQGPLPFIGVWEYVSVSTSSGSSTGWSYSTLEFRDDGTGAMSSLGGIPFTWTHAAGTDQIEMQIHGQTSTMRYEIEGDNLLLVADGNKSLYRRQVLNDEVRGRWFVQFAGGGWVPNDYRFEMVFQDNHAVQVFMDGTAVDFLGTYRLVEDTRRIEMFDGRRLGLVWRYDLADGVLHLTVDSVPAMSAAELANADLSQWEYILTRTPEGTAEHRQARGITEGMHPVNDNPNRQQQSGLNLSALAMKVILQSALHDGSAPATLGATLLNDSPRRPQVYVAPWQHVELPEGWEGAPADDIADWIDAYTGYGYVGAEAAAAALAHEPGDAAGRVLVFELPLFEATERIGVGYADGRNDRLDYAEADGLLRDQTGRGLMEWMGHLGREQTPYRPGVDPSEAVDNARGPSPGPGADE